MTKQLSFEEELELYGADLANQSPADRAFAARITEIAQEARRRTADQITRATGQTTIALELDYELGRAAHFGELNSGDAAKPIEHDNYAHARLMRAWAGKDVEDE